MEIDRTFQMDFFYFMRFFSENPVKTSDFLDVDWVPNQNLGRFSKNIKLLEYQLRKLKKNKTVTMITKTKNLENFLLRNVELLWVYGNF